MNKFYITSKITFIIINIPFLINGISGVCEYQISSCLDKDEKEAYDVDLMDYMNLSYQGVELDHNSFNKLAMSHNELLNIDIKKNINNYCKSIMTPETITSIIESQNINNHVI